MKTDWDYTHLADAYLARPSYAAAVIDAMLKITSSSSTEKICDVGAGVAHLTIMLAERAKTVVAIEPNTAMRNLGIKRTSNFPRVTWFEGTGESTGQLSNCFDMVTFGSSFNVCDRELALEETARILKPGGWFICLWNNRNLNDPIQAEIENIIKEEVPAYKYGSRRQDQRAVLERNTLFRSALHLNGTIIHEQDIQSCIEAWRSHATLARQAGARFEFVVDAIENYLQGLDIDTMQIPYITNVWLAQLK